MRSTIGLCVILFAVSSAGSAHGNDRLPKRLRTSWPTVKTEVRKYIDYIMVKVWRPYVHKLMDAKHPPGKLREKVDAMTDEVVHILLKQSKKITQDVLFGTGSTHLRITRPDLRQKARIATRALIRPGPVTSMQEAVDRLGSISERNLNDRIEQALTEEMEDYVQQALEGAAGLEVRGRPRNWMRPLPKKWSEKYLEKIRQEVHRFTYWWLRKRRRLYLTHMATTMSREEIDKAEHTGPIWKLTSAVSHEAWAQNRLRIDYKWGRLNWEIDRRRIRRRLDQDLAKGAWAMTRLVKELLSPDTMRKVKDELRKMARNELSKPELKEDAERYPETTKKLQKRLKNLLKKLDPQFNKAMDKVKLPDHMKDLAREHGRRFMHEELRGSLFRAIQSEAAPFAAARRVKDKIKPWVAEALSQLDPGKDTASAYRQRAKEFAKKFVRPKAVEEASESLRASGYDDLYWSRKERKQKVDKVLERFEIDKQVEREVDAQLRPVDQP